MRFATMSKICLIFIFSSLAVSSGRSHYPSEHATKTFSGLDERNPQEWKGGSSEKLYAIPKQSELDEFGSNERKIWPTNDMDIGDEMQKSTTIVSDQFINEIRREKRSPRKKVSYLAEKKGNKNNNSPKASNTPKTQKQPDPDKLKKHELARQAKNYQKMNEKNVVKEIESDPLVRVIKAKSAYPYGSGAGSLHPRADYGIRPEGTRINDGKRNIYIPPANKGGLIPVYRAEGPTNQRLDAKVGLRYSKDQSINIDKKALPDSMVWVSIGGPPQRTIDFMKQGRDTRIGVYKKELEKGLITKAEFNEKLAMENSGRGQTIRTGYISADLARKIIRSSRPEHGRLPGEKTPDVINTDITKAYNQFGVKGQLAVQMSDQMQKNGIREGIFKK